MAWLFRCFFIMIGVCIVIEVVKKIKDATAKEHTGEAELTQKGKRNFPFSVGPVRKNQTEYLLTFLVKEKGDEKGKEVTFEVKKKLYDQLPKGTTGELTWRGNWLKTFQAKTYPRMNRTPEPYPYPKKQTQEEEFSPAKPVPVKAQSFAAGSPAAEPAPAQVQEVLNENAQSE